VVAALEDAAGEKRLAAYLVAKCATVPAISELRRFLSETLPDYMVPSAFVFVEELPLTPNGKIDRRALPASGQLEPAEQRAPAAPRDPLERQLLHIWQTTLGRRDVGVSDNFFEMGGHSLLAVRLFAQVEKLVGRKLPLATLFLAPTVAQLAAALRKSGWREPWSSLVPIQPAGARTPFFCVHGLGGNVLNLSDLARRLGPDQPFYGLQSAGLDGERAPYARCEEMAAHYLKEIRALQPEGPYLLGGVSFGGLVAWEMATQLRAQGAEVGLVVLFDTYCLNFLKSLPKPLYYRYKLASHWHRVRHNFGRFLEAPSKLRFVRGKWLGAQRKIGSRLWQWHYQRNVQSDKAVPRHLHDVREANFLASVSYRPQPYAGRVVLFRSTDRAVGHDRDTAFTWTHLTGGRVEIHEVPGDHNTMVLEPNVAALAERLKACFAVAATRV
jgi:thioesterase domain-containing protein